jgi:hypothetical protein
MDDDSIKPITNQGFFAYVFKLSKFKQQDLLNILQYSAISIIPVILFVYFTKKYFPSITYEDSSLYIVIVTFIELMFMIIGIFFIDRIINFIPTYSGKYYETINLTTVIIVFVIAMFLSQAGFRERAAILLYRFDNWFTIDDMIITKLGYQPKPFSLLKAEEGQYNLEVGRVSGEGRPDVAQDTIRKNKSKLKSKNGAVSTQQATINPQMSQQYAVPPPLPVQGPSIPNYGGGGGGGSGGGNMAPPVQNFNSMYAGPVNPLVNAATPGMDDSFMEPMAANSVLGGGCWGSSW